MIVVETRMIRVLPKHVLTVGSISASIFTGLNLMGLIPFGGLSFTNGIMMITFGLVIAVDFFNERRGKVPQDLRLLEVVALTLLVPALFLGVITLLEIP